MLKTPGAPSKSKRGSHLLRNFCGESAGTAPNTPDDKNGIVKVLANEYDPLQDLEALASRNVPPSPLRGDLNSITDSGQRSSEEEKKESEQQDVVSKTLALFDNLCAAPEKPPLLLDHHHPQSRPPVLLDQHHPQPRPQRPAPANNRCFASFTTRSKKDLFLNSESDHEPLLDDELETLTNPSLPSEDSDPYSIATAFASMMFPDQPSSNTTSTRRMIPRSASQEHENFEVILDSASLFSEEEDETPPPPSSSTSSMSSPILQRRWPFKSTTTTEKDCNTTTPSKRSLSNKDTNKNVKGAVLKGRSSMPKHKDVMPLPKKTTESVPTQLSAMEIARDPVKLVTPHPKTDDPLSSKKSVASMKSVPAKPLLVKETLAPSFIPSSFVQSGGTIMTRTTAAAQEEDDNDDGFFDRFHPDNTHAAVLDPILEEEVEAISSSVAVAVAVHHSPHSGSPTPATTPRNSLVQRSWKSAKKLIAKAGGNSGGGTVAKGLEHHPAEVDTEAQHALSFEQHERLVEEQAVADDKNQDALTRTKNTVSPQQEDGEILASAADMWNSIVASVAGTFDPEVAAAAQISSLEATKRTMESKEKEESVEQAAAATADAADTTPPFQPESEVVLPSKKDRAKSKRKSKPSSGWKLLKQLVLSPKKENSNKQQNVGNETPIASSSRIVSPTTPANKSPSSNTAVATQEKPKSHHTPDTKNDPSSKMAAEEMPRSKHQRRKTAWKAVKDKDSGRTYYYHRKTRETTWIKPKEFAQYEADQKKRRAAKAIQKENQSNAKANEVCNDKNVPTKSSMKDEKPLLNRPNSPRVASWPSSSTTSTGRTKAKDDTRIRRTVTPPARPDNTVVSMIAQSMANSKKEPLDKIAKKDGNSEPNWEKRNEVERLLKNLPPDDSRPSVDKLMRDYAGRENDLVKELRAKVEALPFDETQPFDEPLGMEERKRSLRSNTPRSPNRMGQRTMTYFSKASATTKSSALTDRTEKIKNTGKNGASPFVPLAEALSSATGYSNRHDSFRRFVTPSPSPRVPSRVPVPRERQLMVEELTDSRISAESYEGNGGKRGRIVRRRERPPTKQLDTVDDGDNDTEEENTAFDNDTYGTDSVSALSENDTDFLQRKDNFEQARRRALDDAIEREDWDLAAALSEGMRAANMPGGYERAHTSWNQSELDKFIANNDWSAVKRYISRMREKSQTSANKNIGAKSQLQHKALVSESSWTSDSQSSYDSYDSESEV